MADETDLKLQVGDTLQLQFVGDDTNRRFYTRIIGYLPPKSLIVTSPRNEGKVLMLREGQQFVARMLSGNSVYGFNTGVLRVCAQPYPYVHLTYPKELEHIVVRKAHRAKADLIASVQSERAENPEQETISASIVDISTSGALLHSDHKLGDKEELLTINTRLNVGEVMEYLAIPAIIRNVRRESEEGGTGSRYATGVEFQLMDQHNSVVLHGFVYERLIKG